MAIKGNVGFSVGDTACCVRTATSDTIRSFAEVSDDYNPIHLDDEYAKGTVFEKRIAHGLFCLSSISALLGTKLPGRGAILLQENVRYCAPVYVNDSIITTVRVKEIDEGKKKVCMDLECKNGDGKLVLIGEAVLKYGEE